MPQVNFTCQDGAFQNEHNDTHTRLSSIQHSSHRFLDYPPTPGNTITVPGSGTDRFFFLLFLIKENKE